MPIISIIIPVYNASKTLDRCIQSILKQTFTNFELLLINDGSSDDSFSICEKYSVLDSRVKVISLEENTGASNARNKALEEAIGKYIMFADSDDYVAMNWCEYLYEAKCKHSSAMIVTNLYDVFETGNCKQRLANNHSIKRLDSYYYLFKMGISGYLCNKIFDRDIILKNNLKFIKGQICGEDVAFIIKYLKYCNSYYYISEPLYYYVQNTVSLTHKYYENKLKENIDAFAVRLPLIEKEHIGQYCDSYFPYLLGLFKNIFDKECKLNLFQKLRYNQKAMNSKQFRFCINHITGKNESPLFLMIVKTHNYYLLWLFQKLCSIKNK